MTYQQWIEKAKALGATEISHGINWTWALGFPTKEAATEFANCDPEMETRGVYPPQTGEDTYSVRFR